MVMRLIIALLLATVLAVQTAFTQWSWTEVSPMNQPRTGMAIAVWEGKIYAFGGASHLPRPQIIASSEVYDPDEDEWRYIEPLPVPLYQATAITTGAGIIILGGLSPRGASKDVFLYHPLRNAYQKISQMPHPRYSLRAVLIRGDILIVGGMSEHMDFTRENWWWRRGDDRWEEGPTNVYPCSGAGLILHEHPMLLGGNYQGLLDRIEVLREGQWTIWRENRLPQPLADFGSGVIGDTLIILAGGSSAMMRGTNTVWAYHFTQREWTEFPPLTYPRAGLEMAIVNDRAFAIGGFSWIRGGQVEVRREVEALSYLQSASESGERRDEYPLPNPSFTIWWENGWGVAPKLPREGELRLYDLNGRLIYQLFTPSSSIALINVRGLSSGVYFLRIEMAGSSPLYGRLIVLP